MVRDIGGKLERSVRGWKTAAIIMAAVTAATLGMLMPPVIADVSPPAFYRRALGIVPREYKVQPRPDADSDGLPDWMEAARGTNPQAPDTDADGLPDYEEVRKYGTDPAAPDSDSDGTPDSDWRERREYAYTIRAVVDLRPPFRLSDMNDLYQDARLVEALPGDMSRFEVVLYPEAGEILNPAAYAPVDSAYTAPTYAKDWDLQMQEDLLRRIGRPETDIMAVHSVLVFLNAAFRHVSSGKDLGYVGAPPLQFDAYKDEQGGIHKYYSGRFTGYSMDEVEQRVFFARGMYRHRTHEDCSSMATLRGAMLRAVGLEERTLFSIPLFYAQESDGTVIDMKRDYPKEHITRGDSGAALADHFYNVVKIGVRWVRIDADRIDAGLNGPNVKLLLCHDQADHRFQYWNFDTWRVKRPYVYRFIGDQEPVHGKGLAGT